MKRVSLQIITPNSEQIEITLSNLNLGVGKLVDYAGICLNSEYGPRRKKNLSSGFANNKGVSVQSDQRLCYSLI